jgi:hypothetical protein
MPDMAPAAGGAPQPPAQGGQPPPFGTSPATGPTPNKGYEAAGLQRLGVVIRQLEQLVPMLGIASDPGKDVMKALNMLAKHVPPGAVTPAAEKNSIEKMAMQNAQQGQQMQQMRKMGSPAAGGQAAAA